MELSVRDAATLLGRSLRTLRGQVARGDVAGYKRDGRWLIPSETLRLTETQRQGLQARADEVREAVAAALPSRAADTREKRRHSVADLEPFLSAEPVLREMRAAVASGEEALAAATSRANVRRSSPRPTRRSCACASVCGWRATWVRCRPVPGATPPASWQR